MSALATFYDPIQAPLKRVEEVLSKEALCENSFVNALQKHVTQFQGKRARPALLLHTATLCGSIDDVHIKLAVVVELLHTATLLHDDVLDEALLRRRTETLNARWGNEAAIMFGDYLFAKAFRLCAQLNIMRAVEMFSATTAQICIGELSQIARKFQIDVTEEEYLNIIRLKTASLFATTCRLGSIKAHLTPEHEESLARFGLHFGNAFQIMDDWLDIMGDEGEMGKSLGTDLEHGKLTLPLIKLREVLTNSERKQFQEWLFSPDGLPQKKQKIRSYIEKYNIGEVVIPTATRFIEQAKQELAPFDSSPSAKLLKEFADSTLERRR